MSVAVNTVAAVPVTYTDSTGAGVTGLTVTATARLAGSATTVSAVATERGSGDYDVAFTPTAAGTWYLTATATVEGIAVPLKATVDAKTAAQNDPAASITALYGAELANLDAAVSSRATVASVTSALGTASLTVVSPVAANGDVEIIQGDDYLNVDARALAWASTSASQWPDLTGASIAFKATHPTDKSRTLTTTGTVTTATGGTKAVRVELTKTQTAALLTAAYPFQVIATLSNADVVTLVDATMTVLARRG